MIYFYVDIYIIRQNKYSEVTLMSLFLEVTAAFDAFKKFFVSLKNSFCNFEVSDAFDIFFLTIILFVAFRFFKSRKAGALLVGAGAIILLTYLAEIFDLDATYYIFSSILEIGVLAIIIIFMPEIRDVLEKVGSGSVSGFMNFGDQKKKRQNYTKLVDQVCTAVSALSSSKTGALIVISRTTKLDDVVETGITINADINSYLLRNIFFNKAPLHDGAVIIDESKIVAAGCLLPLTRRTDIDGDLGTRHRAAIGMSEISDAIVIVVSEETGVISVACDCTLTRNYQIESLRSYLLKK